MRPEDSDPALPRIVLGSLAEPWMLALAEKAGFAGEDDEGQPRIKAYGISLGHAGEVLIATVPDPERAGLPLTFYLGAEAAEVAANLDDLAPCHRPGLVARRRGSLLFELPFKADGEPDWSRHVDYQARRRQGGAPLPLEQGGVVLRLQPGVNRQRAVLYADLMADIRRRTITTLGAGTLADPLVVRVQGSLAEVQGRRGEEELAHAPPASPGEVVALLADRLPHDGGAAAARATALELLGRPAADWLLDGVGTAFADTWWWRRKTEWVVVLAQAGLVPPVADLVAPDAPRRLSPHLLVPLRGELFTYLVAERGAEEVVRLWRGEESLVLDAALEAGFRARIERLSVLLGPRVAEERSRRAELAEGEEWRDGICFVPAGDADEVFASSGVRESLVAAREAGAGAVVLLPLAYLDARPRLFAGLAPRPWPDASPGDLALASAVVEARSLGLRVMLAPQVMASPAGTWADALSLGGDDGIREFFAAYGRVLSHYALLGELLGVELLCLGNERVLVTNTRVDAGDDEVTRQRCELLLGLWRALIADVRRAFSGRLTYAAESTTELDNVGFWEDLDFVGVDLFLPVEEPRGDIGRQQARARLAASLGQCLDQAQRAGRPLLIVQAGYPSHDTAHESPLLARGRVDVELQANLLELLSEALRDARARGPLAGVFLWRWDPDPHAGGAADPSHTPQGKPAEALLKSFFRR